jgi:phosphate transport system substrate-binding protein
MLTGLDACGSHGLGPSLGGELMASGHCSPSGVPTANRPTGRSGSLRLRFQAAAASLAVLVIVLSLAPIKSGAQPTITQSIADTLLFAGCDSNIPVTRMLARVFMQKHPNVRIRLETIGSTNGVALAAAGVIQLGLVSRPLRDSEEKLGLAFLPYATTAVVIGAAPGTPDAALTARDLLSFYRGTKLQWKSGREIVLLTREDGDSAVTSLKRLMPGFAEAYAAGSHTGHWTITYSEPTMHEALMTFPFALGLSDLGTITLEQLPIKMLSVDGIAPTLDNVASGTYPFTKTLGFVWRKDVLPDSARSFVDFVQSPEGTAILTSSGYLPGR